jgi:hypothetical protein
MTTLVAVKAIHVCFGIVWLWVLFYISGRTLLLDNLRQRLFAIRDSLFDFAADGGISFDDENYRELRADINLLIRFAHKMSFGRVIFSIPIENPATLRVRDWTARVMQLEPLSRKRLIQIRSAVLDEMLRYIIRRSLVLWIISSILKLVGLFVDAVSNFNRTLPKFAESLEAQALSDEYRLAS